ncbi:MAG: hypothetical protein KY445_02735 [Armatimonadetes bacterium]|nr:hypothetical protein [Armatimonadota bacterium]
MAATYDFSLPTLLDQARFLFRDVGGLENGVVTKPLLENEEYLGAVRVWGDVEGLAKVAESLASSFAQKVKKYANTRGGTSVEWPDRPDFYLQLAASIRTNGVGTMVMMAGAPALPSALPTLTRDGSLKDPDSRLYFL